MMLGQAPCLAMPPSHAEFQAAVKCNCKKKMRKKILSYLIMLEIFQMDLLYNRFIHGSSIPGLSSDWLEMA
jgi:hypothetical protein